MPAKATSGAAHSIPVAEARYRLIKQGFFLTGTKFSSLAKRLRVTPSAITHVARGVRTSKRIQRALARVIGVPYRDLWGD